MTYKAYYNNNVHNEGIKDTVKAGILGLGMLAGSASNAYATAPAIYRINPNELYSQISKHEGIEPSVYKDTLKHPTIGIGFNLDDKSNQQKLAKLGINLNELLSGKELSQTQIKQLYNLSLTTAYADAKKFLPNLQSHPVEVQKAIIDMSFNLGINKLMQFKKLRNALATKNYKLAAAEMLNSNWASQVGRRAQTLASMVRSAS
jgi:lysozyme